MTKTQSEWFQFNQTFVCRDCDQKVPRRCQGDCKPKCPVALPVAIKEASDYQVEEEKKEELATSQVVERQNSAYYQNETDHSYVSQYGEKVNLSTRQRHYEANKS